jgi:crotonobetainyl-CoA:carnitine CoA-transferase CaiB-like acyl-CoA transferase
MHFPWAPVVTPEAVLECPQHQSRGFFIDIDHLQDKTPLKVPRLPYRISSQTVDRCRRAPFVGEDNERIYVNELGFTEKDLNRLSVEKVI